MRLKWVFWKSVALVLGVFGLPIIWLGRGVEAYGRWRDEGIQNGRQRPLMAVEKAIFWIVAVPFVFYCFVVLAWADRRLARAEGILYGCD